MLQRAVGAPGAMRRDGRRSRGMGSVISMDDPLAVSAPSRWEYNLSSSSGVGPATAELPCQACVPYLAHSFPQSHLSPPQAR